MPSKAFTEFRARLNDISTARDRLEKTLPATTGPHPDILLAYEGLFLRLIVAFEGYLERYLAELLDQAHVPTVNGFALQCRFVSPDVREAAVLNREDYISWLPYERTVEVAELYLKDGIPFSIVTGNQKGEVKKMYILRHAVAHSGAHAQKKFKDSVIGTAKLPSDEQTPAGYLRGAYRTSPRTTRLELFLQQLLQLAQTIDP